MIIGPSHVVRWEKLKAFFAMDCIFYGVGGLPVWHESVKERVLDDNVMILVGDFRFGNSYHLTGVEKDAFSVKKELINPEVDEWMLQRSLCALDLMKDQAPKLVFWCLFIREYKNIQAGKYIHNGKYRHPHWNLYDLERKYNNAVRLTDILNQDLDFLYIDSSNHPSLFGYYFLKKIEQGLSPKDALRVTCEAKKRFFSIFKVFGFDRIVVSGTNSTFRLIKDYCLRGIVGPYDFGNLQLREADEALFSSYKFHKNIIYFAKEEDAKTHMEQLSYFDKAPYENKVLVVKEGFKTLFYTAKSQQKPILAFVMMNAEEDLEVVGDIYNLLGLSQVMYYALAILNSSILSKGSPYFSLKCAFEEAGS